MALLCGISFNECIFPPTLISFAGGYGGKDKTIVTLFSHKEVICHYSRWKLVLIIFLISWDYLNLSLTMSCTIILDKVINDWITFIYYLYFSLFYILWYILYHIQFSLYVCDYIYLHIHVYHIYSLRNPSTCWFNLKRNDSGAQRLGFS